MDDIATICKAHISSQMYIGHLGRIVRKTIYEREWMHLHNSSEQSWHLSKGTCKYIVISRV